MDTVLPSLISEKCRFKNEITFIQQHIVIAGQIVSTNIFLTARIGFPWNINTRKTWMILQNHNEWTAEIKRSERPHNPWMNTHPVNEKKYGAFQTVGLYLLLFATRRHCFSLQIKPLLSGLFDHMLGRFEVAASCHTCVPTKWMAHGRISDTEATRERRRLPELNHGSWAAYTRWIRRRKRRGERRAWGGWRWEPREAIVSHHWRLREPGFNSRGVTARCIRLRKFSDCVQWL